MDILGGIKMFVTNKCLNGVENQPNCTCINNCDIVKRYALNEIAQSIDCMANPKTCCKWYVEFYGENPYKPLKYFFRNCVR